MTSSCQRLRVAFAAILAFASVCSAACAQVSQADRTPDSTAIEAFAGKAAIAFPGEATSGTVVVSDRILDGFEAGPSRLVVDRDTTIFWGFKFQEGNLQSVAIFDGNGHPRLLAAVDNVPSLQRGGTWINTLEQYRQAVARSGTSPVVSVFVRDTRDLQTYLPYLKRWLQADLLGFNVHCDKLGMAPTCAVAEQIEVPIQAYMLSPGTTDAQALSLPKLQAASVPLESFVQ